MRQELAMLMREFYGDGTYARFFDRAGRLELNERFYCLRSKRSK